MKYEDKYNDSINRGIPFELTPKQFEALKAKTHCYYTGAKFSDAPKSGYRRTFDRINADEGYTVENTVLCTHAANNAKNQLFESADRSRLTMWEASRMLMKLWLIGFKVTRPRNER